MKLSAEIELLTASNEVQVFANNKTEIIRIESQLMQLLLVLAESKGNLVDRNVFIEKVWDGNFFSGDVALTKSIFKLREIFKNNGIEGKIIIETIPKKGYRLLVPGNNGSEKVGVGKKMMITVAILIAVVISFIYGMKNSSANNANTPAVTIIGNDTVIHLDKNKKVQVIDTMKYK